MGLVRNILRGIKRRNNMPAKNALMEGISTGSRAFCGPEELYIDLTNRCNLNCITCWHRSPLLVTEEILPHWNSAYELPLEKVLSVIDQAAALGVRKIIYSGGGDPLLYGDLFEVIDHTSRKGMQMLLVTNLTTATEDTLRHIVRSGVRQVLVNLWAGTPSVYAAMHPGTSGKTFSRVVEMMKLLVALRGAATDPVLIISSVISSINYKDLENIIRLAMEIGAGGIWYQTVGIESDHLRRLALNKEQIKELVADIRMLQDKYRTALRDGRRELLAFDDFMEKQTNSRATEGIYHSDVVDTMPCYMGWATCRILANGAVVPCCKGDSHPLGDIHREDFSTIWLSASYNEFRAKAKSCPKSDPYFGRINCARGCDNWWFNKIIHSRYTGYMQRRA